MKTSSQGNRWLVRFRRGFAFLLAPMFMVGLILFMPTVTLASYAWHTFYGSNDLDNTGMGIVLDENGNIYMTGYGRASWQGDGGANPLHAYSGNYDFFVVKLNKNGIYQWHTFYGASGDDFSSAIALDGSGNVYVSGTSRASWKGNGGANPLHAYSQEGDIFVLKLDGNGTYEWHTFYGGAAYDSSSGIAVDGSGNVYVSGTSDGSWQGDGARNPLHPYSQESDILVLKLDGSGTYQWHTFYGSGRGDAGSAIALDGSGGVYITGNSNHESWEGDGSADPLHPFSGFSDIYVLKLDSNGAYQWHTFYGAGGYDDGQGIAVDGGGNVYVSGTSDASWQGDGGGNPLHPYSGDKDIAILKLNSSGIYQWHTFYGSPDWDQGFGIASDAGGGVSLTGNSSTTWQGDGGANPFHAHAGAGHLHITVLKLNSDGAYLWHTFYGSSSQDSGQSICVDDRGGVFVTGGSAGTWQGDEGANPIHAHSGNYDTFILALESSGVQPGQGTLGTEITIAGSGFGAKKGKVLLGQTSLKILAWTDQGIRCTLSKAMLAGSYDMTIQPSKMDPVVLGGAFTVMAPQIGSVEPANGSTGDEIVMDGFYFGTKKGKVTLEGKNCKVLTWTMDPATGESEVHFVVPKGLSAGTHELKVTNGMGTDSVEFDVE